jgi:hypothetical protein
MQRKAPLHILAKLKRITHAEDMRKSDMYELIRAHKPMYHTYKIGFWLNMVTALSPRIESGQVIMGSC